MEFDQVQCLAWPFGLQCWQFSGSQTIVRIMGCSLWVKVHILSFIVFRRYAFLIVSPSHKMIPQVHCKTFFLDETQVMKTLCSLYVSL